LFVAPAIIPSANLMKLSRRSSSLILPMPHLELLHIEIVKQTVTAKSRLGANWTIVNDGECFFIVPKSRIPQAALSEG
jgi:hypothetical protein